MSCFILAAGRLSRLAKSIHTAISPGAHAFLGFYPDERTARIIRKRSAEYGEGEPAVYAALLELNATACDTRYKEYTDREAFPFQEQAADYLARPLVFTDFTPEYTAEHYALLKTLDCYLYQTAEQATEADELREALQDLRAGLADMIIISRPEYIAAKWG